MSRTIHIGCQSYTVESHADSQAVKINGVSILKDELLSGLDELRETVEKVEQTDTEGFDLCVEGAEHAEIFRTHDGKVYAGLHTSNNARVLVEITYTWLDGMSIELGVQSNAISQRSAVTYTNGLYFFDAAASRQLAAFFAVLTEPETRERLQKMFDS